MITRVTNDAYVNPRELYAWMIEHPNQAQDVVFKKEVFRIANMRTPEDDSALNLLKVQALKRTGWYREWNDTAFTTINSYATQMMQGDFTYEAQGRMLLEVHREADAKDSLAEARFYAPLIVMRGGVNPDEPLAVARRLPVQALQQAGQEMAMANPSQGFWFSGSQWNDEQLRIVTHAMPHVVTMARAECAHYRINPTQDPPHVSPDACNWLK